MAWVAYFALHSALASLTVKHWAAGRFPRLMPGYRMGFNVLSIIALLPIIWLLYSNPGPKLWVWSGAGAYLPDGVAFVAVVGFIFTLRDYDGSEFLGVRQWRNQTRTVQDQECFHLSAIHRFVRHPWYFMALMILWTRDMSEGMLVSAGIMTCYFVIGAKMEEQKLIAYHGQRYINYMEKVAGLIPLPWKTISASEARGIVSGDTLMGPPKQLVSHPDGKLGANDSSAPSAFENQ
jgi:protein-S-isoprenylcysteine O-methyltransferase Ste14